MDGDKLTFAVTFVKNIDKKTTEIHVQCDKGISMDERVGMLERLKTQLLLENIIDETNQSEPANNG